jgi:hypothetical protein
VFGVPKTGVERFLSTFPVYLQIYPDEVAICNIKLITEIRL